MQSAKKNILLELPYFPSIQFFSKWFGYEHIIVEQWENYQKRSYRNRCHIAAANGLLRLSIPLAKGKNERLPIRAVEIAYEEAWINQHLTAIRSAYGSAPFFDFYFEEIQAVLEKKWTHLFDLNWAILATIQDLIGLEEKAILSSQFEKNPSDDTLDFRNKIRPQETSYLLDKQFVVEEYTQVFQSKIGFLPNLSILDLLFCKGPESILYLEESWTF